MSLALDLGYRIVAIASCLYCIRRVWHGLAERQIALINDDWLDWSRWSRQVFYRDTMPIRYWMQIVGAMITSVLCFVAAIVGWWPPNG